MGIQIGMSMSMSYVDVAALEFAALSLHIFSLLPARSHAHGSSLLWLLLLFCLSAAAAADAVAVACG